MQKTSTQQHAMGAVVQKRGVSFRVWAPHADQVFVMGSFNQWREKELEMEAEEGGYWHLYLDQANIGDEYKYVIINGEQTLRRNDPYAREVTNSVGNSVISDPCFDWGDDHFEMASMNELVIYELHIGTFHRTDREQPATFDDVIPKLEYLKWLGINAIQIMPVAEFAGDYSWGYNPAHPFAVESAYGGPQALKRLVKSAHEQGLAVILDVVYNHFGPSDLDLWQFDGWSENGKGGIYFYNDWRSATPWGDSRPDYGRGEVRQYIFDNAMMWLDEFRMDGLRYDMTLYIRSVDGSDHNSIEEGWSLSRWINNEIHQRYPGKITIAEDLQSNAIITAPKEWGGADFSTQWDAGFVHPVREVITTVNDQDRDLNKLVDAITHRYNLDVFERVIYTESHDEVANGKQRLVSEVDSGNPHGWFARKRSTLAAAMVLTCPGIPMLFQGQEFLTPGWFDDGNPIDWEQAGSQDELLRLYRDLIRLRRNLDGTTAGLAGQNVDVHHVNHQEKVVAFRRWLNGGPDDECVVILNLANRNWHEYTIGLPRPGRWKVRLDSGSSFYGEDFEGTTAGEYDASNQSYDGQPCSTAIACSPYSVIVLSQDATE